MIAESGFVVSEIAGYSVDDHDFLVMEGYDDCIVGVEESGMRVCYDSEKVIEKNMEMGMSREEAIDWYSFNQLGAYVGPSTPLFVSVGGAL